MMIVALASIAIWAGLLAARQLATACEASVRAFS
jgi:hypothetical protein